MGMTDLPYPSRACPICMGAPSSVLFRQRFGDFSEGSLLTGYDVSVCRRCGFVYADRIPTQAAFNRHYAEMSKYEYADRGGEVSQFDSARFEDIAALISSKVLDRSLRILDVGCATGGLLAALRKLGYEAVCGLDPSPSCARCANTVYDIRVEVGNIFEHPFRSESFDVAILVGVLEHVRDLRPALRSIESCLSSDALVYAEVPNLSEFLNWPGAPFQEFSTEHIGFFGPKSLKNLFRSLGYEQVAMDLIPREFTATTVMPSACGLFRRTGAAVPGPIRFDDQTEPAMRAYVRRSSDQEARVLEIVASLAASGREVAVWGVGTQTRRLLESTVLARANITAFIDSNPNYQGKTLHNRPILSPRDFQSHSEPILVGSFAFQDDIVRLIRDTLAMDNELILLYEGSNR